ncbi:hypothetical protein BOTNAR_0114g00030 [Botryotinia narcissicola]|uniref:Phosphoglycerate mutase family protein n=1 Tax=Botryotinia narcissicola TaxID=278944 RepID=A0A4Z1IM25_9HELO|nr:hypothetical protein BOTNAR_0114g00030 [Botryotinia narcissicola]
MTITLHFVRHAQGFHNLCTANHTLPDPLLTDLGKAQCTTLSQTFPSPEKITHIVASPLRRTLYTALYSFPSAIARGIKVIALPEIQETSTFPCDTGSAPAALAEEFAGSVDLGLVHEGWNSKSGRWASNAPAIEKRAREARVWLRELGLRAEKEGMEDVNIVVVTHGGFLHYFTDDWEDSSLFVGTGWTNTEFRSYHFRAADSSDPNAAVQETKESRERRKGTERPLTDDEQRNLRAAAESGWQQDGFQQKVKNEEGKEVEVVA